MLTSKEGIRGGMRVLKRRAPWEPPKIRRCGGILGVGGATEKNSGRTGIPFTSALRNHLAAGGKFTAAALTRFPTIRLAMPGTALGSKAMVGMPLRIAAPIAGPDAYPPTPNTASARNSRMMREQAMRLNGSPMKVRSLVSNET